MKHQNNHGQTTHGRPASSNNFASRLLHRALNDRKRPTSEMEMSHAPNGMSAAGGQKVEAQSAAASER